MRIDLHLHTTASDGTDTPAELMRRASEAGISVVSVTDHDTVEGVAAARAALPSGMTLVSGVELSCVTDGDDGFRCHILGYGIDCTAEPMRYAIEEGMRKRREKLYSRLDYIKRNFGISFSDGELAELEAYNAVSKLHIARLLVAHGHAENIGAAIDKYLGARSPDDRIDAALAVDAILCSGGIPVYAHPIGGEREMRLSASELYRRAHELRHIGVLGLEGYYSRYTARNRAPILEAARQLRLLVSGGSDYHGANKTVALGCLDADGCEISDGEITLLRHI